MVKKLNNQNFKDEVLDNKGTVLVDFYAEWCGPCKMIAPVIDEIAAERTDITVGKLNVDESGALAAQYNVTGVPTMIVFKDGKETERLVGFKPKAAILAKL